MKSRLVKLVIGFLFGVLILTHTQVNAAQQAENRKLSNIPMLANVNQTSSNQLQITYDQPVDITKGINPMNYWIQSTMEATPTGIATLGMNDKVNASNSLTAEKVTIKPLGNGGKSFILTFSQSINKGMVYKVIICFVTKPGAPPYTGDNGSATFVGI